MRLFNKFVESKKEPINKNDIWFDGSVFRIYKEGDWIPISLTQEAIDRLIEYAKSLDIYIMVNELPDSGEEGKIYVLQTIGDNSVELLEYIWENDSWKPVDNFNSVSLVLDTELSETSHNAVANYVITEALKNKADKSELVTPDWNASLGKAGFIENKPIFISHFRNTFISIQMNESNNKNFEDIHDDDGYCIGIKSKPSYNYFEFDRTYGFYIKSSSYFYEEYKTLSVEDSILNNKSITLSGDNNDNYIYTLYFKEEYWKENDANTVVLYIMFNEGNYNYEDLICGEHDYFCIKTLPEFYLPDTVLKTTPQTLSDSDKSQVKENLGISTPDWNAESGEGGHIKNRTHFFEWYAKPEDENFNDLLLGLKDKTPISVTEDGHIKTVKYLANECSPMWEQGFEYFDKQWKLSSYDIFDGFVTVPNIFGHPKISISIEEDDDYNELTYVTIQWDTEDTTDDVNEVIDDICLGYYIIPYRNYHIWQLNDKYIPGTIARTEDLESLYEETEALWENVQSIDEEITKLSEKKVDADKVATINGQSLVNGGNIKIDTTTHEGGLVDGYIRLKFQYDADRGLYEAKLDIIDMGKIYQDFRFDGIGGTVRHLHEVDLHKPNNIILDTDGSGNIRYGTLVFIDQESPEQEYVYYQISEEDWNDSITDSFYNGNDTTLLPVSEILIPESIARKEYVNERIEDIEVFVEDLYNNTIQKEADDYYPQLSVGVADNLAGVDVVASAFTIRRSGGGAITDGVARVQSIKGNSEVWNQLFDIHAADRSYNENGVHITDNRDGSYTISTDDGGATQKVFRSISATHSLNIAGHKLLITGCDGAKDGFGFWDSFSNTIGTIFKNNTIVTASGNGQTAFSIIINEGLIVSQTTWKPRVFDLTLMFGAGNEPTTIEEFYQRIPYSIDVRAYNKGEVIPFTGEGIKSIGDNAWDEEWEVGSLDTTTGENVFHTGNFRCKNYIQVLGGKKYYCYNAGKDSEGHYYAWALFFDQDKKVIVDPLGYGRNYVEINNREITMPLSARYMRFYVAYSTTYNHDICINLSDADINGQYFPHEEASEDLSIVAKYFPQGLKSAGSAHDEIRYNKQSNKWEAVQRIGFVDMGSLEWEYQMESTGAFFRATIADKRTDVVIEQISRLLCRLYASGVVTYYSRTKQDKTIYESVTAADLIDIYVTDSAYTDAASFKAAMQGVILYYELAEPIVTEIAEPFNLDYKVWNGGTEEVISDAPTTPLKAEITYGFNAIGKIKELESNQGVSKEYVDNAIASALGTIINGDY